MGHRLRIVMQRGSVLKFRVDVEVGGSAPFMRKRNRAAKINGGNGVVGKVAVMGLPQRARSRRAQHRADHHRPRHQSPRNRQ
jgi:hypothetical protein